MKLTLLTLTFLLSFIGLSQFEALPDSNATWHVTHLDFGFLTHNNHVVPAYDYDTIINGEQYSKVYLSDCDWQIHAYEGAYRSSTNGETFFIPSGETVEHYLFKYNVVVGDTIVIWSPDNGFNGPFSEDSIVIGSTGASVGFQFLSNGNYSTWTEGTGSPDYGIFTSTAVYFGIVEMQCLGVYDVTIPPHSMADLCANCDSYNDLSEIEINGLVVVPNPFKNSIKIDEGTDLSGAVIEVYHLDGRLVETSKLNSDNSVDLNSLAPGEYLLKITSNESVYSERVTKM